MVYVKPMGSQIHCLDVYPEKLFEQIRKNYCLGIEESVSTFHVFSIYLTMLSLQNGKIKHIFTTSTNI